MYQRPASPQLIGGVLDNAFRLLIAAFTQVVGLAIAASAIAGAWRLFDNTLDDLVAGTFNPEDASLQDVVPILAGGFVGMYFYLAVVGRMAAFAANRPIGFAEALRRALLRFPAFLVCLFATVVVLAAPVLLTMALIGGYGPGGVVAALLLLPAFAAIVYLYFAPFLVVADNIGGIAALRRSVDLVRRHFWRVAAILTVGSIIMFAATMLVGVAALAVAALAGIGNVSVDAAAFLVETVGGALTTPFWIALSLSLLRDLELRRGGDDLAARIKAAP